LKLHGPIKYLGSFFGIGYLPGLNGTYASAITAGILMLAFYLGAPMWAIILATILAIFLAVPIATRFEQQANSKDPHPFVLDEVVGMMIAGLVLWTPWNSGMWAIIVSFILFRILDITKSFPISEMEYLPKGWGIVMDDVAAGIIALGITFFLFK